MQLIVSVVQSVPPKMNIYSCLLFLHLLSFLPFCVNAGKWMLIGGYAGVEGQAGSTALGDVEMLTLEQEDKFGVKSEWCQRSLSDAPTALHLATVDWVDAFQYVSKHCKFSNIVQKYIFANDNSIVISVSVCFYIMYVNVFV